MRSVSDRSFIEIFRREVARYGFEFDPVVAEHMLALCRNRGGLGLCACYPRDICEITACINAYEERPSQLSLGDLERAVDLYFAEDVKVAANGKVG